MKCDLAIMIVHDSFYKIPFDVVPFDENLLLQRGIFSPKTYDFQHFSG